MIEIEWLVLAGLTVSGLTWWLCWSRAEGRWQEENERWARSQEHLAVAREENQRLEEQIRALRGLHDLTVKSLQDHKRMYRLFEVVRDACELAFGEDPDPAELSDFPPEVAFDPGEGYRALRQDEVIRATDENNILRQGGIMRLRWDSEGPTEEVGLTVSEANKQWHWTGEQGRVWVYRRKVSA